MTPPKPTQGWAVLKNGEIDYIAFGDPNNWQCKDQCIPVTILPAGEATFVDGVEVAARWYEQRTQDKYFADQMRALSPQPKQDEATELRRFNDTIRKVFDDEATKLLEATVREIMLQAPIPERLYEIAVKIETYLKDRG